MCKRHPGLAAEALECLGGNGYVEESIMPRLFRESPLNGIWEGSGNVICLDVLRAMGREPDSVDAFREEVLAAQGADRRFDAHCRRLDAILSDSDDLEGRARRIVEAMALALQAVAADPRRQRSPSPMPSVRHDSTPKCDRRRTARSRRESTPQAIVARARPIAA